MSTVNAVTREAYQFAAEPKAVPSRSKYRDPNEKKSSDYEDIQNDPRVRGAHSLSGAEKSKGHARKATNSVGRNAEEEGAQENIYVQLTNRNHQDDASIRPYYRIDRPPTPEYKPLPPGIEVATQVEDYELFDYILEVEPILQVLVGKTLEQAQIELREEDERIEEARHKMRFEKMRNAELMVTQRKEALHIRKQDEKARREKQHIIEKEAKYIAHQKYISRLFAKHVTTDINNVSIRTLAGQGVLNSNFRTELKKDYVPYLVLTTLYKIRHQGLASVEVQKTLEELQEHLHASHARSVKQEFDRKKKIEDDKKAEQDRLIAEQKRRRERRRLLRLYCNKVETLNKIQNMVMGRPLEVEDLFAADITDVFPTGKEQVATIGGILGELWLVLDSLKENGITDLKLENIVQILVKLLNEKLKNKEITIYVSESQQQNIQTVLDQMANDLIQFNQNKSDYIQELTGQLENMNQFQNLSLLSNENLLDKDIFNEINKALLFIYFTSVDYKIPEKKVEEPKLEATGETKNENNEEGTGEQEPKTSEEQNPEGSEKPAEVTEKLSEEAPPQPEPVQEEEFKLPEVTPFELELLEAKKKLKLTFVADWDFKKDVDGILRIRNPLNKETKQSMDKLEKTNGSSDPVVDTKVASPIEEPPVEDRDSMLRRLIATDDFIEPFNGTTFEKEKENFPEQEVDPAVPTRIYNTGSILPDYICQINERAQKVLRKELIALIKASVAAYNSLPEVSVFEAANDKYNNNEKVILNNLISNPESIPIFDLENL